MKQTIIKIGHSQLSVQAEPLAGSIFGSCVQILPVRGTRSNKNK